jgi:D-glycero-D-manno-heptose 1,7-bisphosphate phosphatase
VSYVFLDRDGTLIRHVPYLCDASHVQLLPTVVRGLGELLRAECRLFLHTNQSGIGRGYFSLTDAAACNDEMLSQIGLGRALFEGVCLCPEAPGQEISYRKPSPKYALEVMVKYATDRSRLCYVGDNITDLLTAKNVGCAGVGVSTGVNELRELLHEHELQRFPVFDNFFDAAMYVVDYFRRSNGTD